MKLSASGAHAPILTTAAAMLAIAALAFTPGATFAQSDASPPGADSTAAAQTASDAWSAGRQWMSVRAGYAKSTEDSSGHGAGGYGMSYSRMLSGFKLWRWTLLRRYSMGASFQHDVIGAFGPATEVGAVATLDLTRHYAWAPAVHPYVGFGVGPYYRKTSGTGNDLRDVSMAWYLSTGLNTPLSNHHVLGVDLRLTRLDGKNDPPNPVFGLGSVKQETRAGVTVFEDSPVTHWSLKATYAFAY